MRPRVVHPEGDPRDLGVLMPDERMPRRAIVRWQSGDIDDAAPTSILPADPGEQIQWAFVAIDDHEDEPWSVSLGGEWHPLRFPRRKRQPQVDEVLDRHREALAAMQAELADGVV